jgi:DNA-binding IclR family transcriptional regulator
VQAAEVSHGNYSDAHARASGKLLLAYSDEQLRTDYLSSHRLTARTKKTVTTLPKLYEEFERIRAAGYATDLEEFSNGLCCLAVGIGNGTQPFALTMSAPTERFEQKFDSYLATMKRIAGELS